MNKKILLIAVMMLTSIGAFAQTQFSIYAGGAFPMGKFKEGELKNKMPNKWVLMDEKGTNGFAGIGFNVGMDLMFPIASVDGLGIIVGADFFYNGYNSELKDWFNDLSDNDDDDDDKDGSEITVSHKPRFMNIPLMVGARYNYEINDGFGIFAEAGVGANLRMISSFKVDYSYSDPWYGYEESMSIEYTYNKSVTFSFKLGAGVMFAEHFSVGLDYYALGSAKVTGKIKSSSDSDDDDYYKGDDSGKFKGKNAFSCSELVLRIGYHF
ncbi:MAG: outer membrane beta-barrel protein [Bacteroidales bacterium]|nr:outer membrane beta-barrel protein [Bacteroidales bacterium]